MRALLFLLTLSGLVSCISFPRAEYNKKHGISEPPSPVARIIPQMLGITPKDPEPTEGESANDQLRIDAPQKVGTRENFVNPYFNKTHRGDG